MLPGDRLREHTSSSIPLIQVTNDPAVETIKYQVRPLFSFLLPFVAETMWPYDVWFCARCSSWTRRASPSCAPETFLQTAATLVALRLYFHALSKYIVFNSSFWYWFLLMCFLRLLLVLECVDESLSSGLLQRLLCHGLAVQWRLCPQRHSPPLESLQLERHLRSYNHFPIFSFIYMIYINR